MVLPELLTTATIVSSEPSYGPAFTTVVAKASEPCGDDDVAGPRQSRQAGQGTVSTEPAISVPTVHPRPITLATDKTYDTGNLSNASGRSRPVPATFTFKRRDFLHSVRQFMCSRREALVQAIDLPSGATYWQTNCIPFKLHSARCSRAPGLLRLRGKTLLSGKKIIVVLPAFNAAKTLKQTVDEIPHTIVDDIILTDDSSSDNTVELARSLGIHTLRHDSRRGYGGNQKTCYAAALARGADIVVMLHPDYQYSPRLVPAMAAMIASGHYDVVLGSRILGNGALHGGMPIYKYIFNRILTLLQNILIGQKLSEYHTGYRGWSRDVLEKLPLLHCSNDFVFDNEILTQAHYFGFRIGEISCPTKYFAEASSINFHRSVIYGLGVLRTSLAYRLHRHGFIRSRLFTRSPDAGLSSLRARATWATL
jgi:hypothetical protein